MRKTITMAVILASGLTLAQSDAFVQHLRCETDIPSGSSLPVRTMLQGTTPMWSCDHYSRGKAQAPSTNGAVRVVVALARTAVGSRIATVTNATTTATGYLIQFPEITTNSGGRVSAPWWYVVTFLDASSHVYWSGSGSLIIEPSAWTNQAGLTLDVQPRTYTNTFATGAY